jgi:hypothetical protein
MEKLLSLLRRLVAGLLPPQAAADPLDTLSPRDWADLPAYHPNCEA